MLEKSAPVNLQSKPIKLGVLNKVVSFDVASDGWHRRGLTVLIAMYHINTVFIDTEWMNTSRFVI